MHRSFSILLIGFVFLLCLKPTTAEGASFSQRICMRLLYALARPLEFVLRPGALYTGYSSNEYGSVPWTEELVRKVVTTDGLNAPLVRNYAKFAGITLEQARLTLAYIKDAPEDVRNFLLVAHSWEALHGNSPFISGSGSRGTASGFGPYPLFTSGVGPSVVFTYQTKNLRILNHTYKWSSSCELLTQVAHFASRKDLEMANHPDRRRLLEIWDWMESHNWLSEMTLPYGYDKNSEYAQSVMHMSPKSRFNDLFNTNIPSWADLKLMEWLESEHTVFLHVPTSEMIDGRLYNSDGKRAVRVVPKN